jgi:hypothetical protein
MRINAGPNLCASAIFAVFSTPDHGASELSAQGRPDGAGRVGLAFGDDGEVMVEEPVVVLSTAEPIVP